MKNSRKAWGTVPGFFLILLLTQSCASTALQEKSNHNPLTPLAEEYVKLGLVMHNHDKQPYLYTGPEEWRTEAREQEVSLPEIQKALMSLRKQVYTVSEPDRKMDQQRRQSMLDRIDAMLVRADILQGKLPASFDEEVRLQFGVQVPQYDEDHFRAVAAELNDLIPGDGELSARVEHFRDQFVIPPDKIEAVITAALAECRKRTKAHITLPENESVELNITTNQHWVGFTEYRGDSKSIIHINQDVPIHLERAIQLGCHEGYPGHHVHASLMQAELVAKQGWIEYDIFPLYGPLSVIAEGAANYGVDVAFSREERIEFERSTILPLAGLPGDQLDLYYRFFDLLDTLNYARNETARRYLHKGLPREMAIEWLMEFGLETRGTASQRLDFIDAQRAYVINYNHGKTLVRQYVESQAGMDRDARWDVFEAVISSPISPQDMIQNNDH